MTRGVRPLYRNQRYMIWRDVFTTALAGPWRRRSSMRRHLDATEGKQRNDVINQIIACLKRAVRRRRCCLHLLH